MGNWLAATAPSCCDRIGEGDGTEERGSEGVKRGPTYSFHPACPNASLNMPRYGTSPIPLKRPPMKTTLRLDSRSPETKYGCDRSLVIGKVESSPEKRGIVCMVSLGCEAEP